MDRTALLLPLERLTPVALSSLGIGDAIPAVKLADAAKGVARRVLLLPLLLLLLLLCVWL